MFLCFQVQAAVVCRHHYHLYLPAFRRVSPFRLVFAAVDVAVVVAAVVDAVVVCVVIDWEQETNQKEQT